MKLIIAFTLAFLAYSQAGQLGLRSFNGYQVITVQSQNDDQFDILKTLFEGDQFDFWTGPVHQGLTDIMAAPEQIQELIEILNRFGMKHVIKIENVETLVANERMENARAAKAANGKISFDRYTSYPLIDEWLQTLKDLPLVNLSIIGKTTEGRNIYSVRIGGGGSNKPVLFIDANIHAREWIAGATATYLINEFVTNSEAHKAIFDALDIIIVPFVNPDGYEYSRTTDRMWRKTRSVNVGSSCKGCDPNRNWSFKFGGEGTSSSPCSDTFKGPSAFSEPETKALSDYIKELRASGTKIGAYMTFHSYGQYMLLPWGYTSGVYPPDYAENLDLGTRAERALNAVNKIRYEVGQGADLLYGVGGASDDWAKNEGIPYTVTVEMRDLGNNGFILPPAQIIPNAKEILEAVLVYAKQVITEANQ